MKPRAGRDDDEPVAAHSLGAIERKEKSPGSPVAVGLDAERLAVRIEGAGSDRPMFAAERDLFARLPGFHVHTSWQCRCRVFFRGKSSRNEARDSVSAVLGDDQECRKCVPD